MNVSAPSALGSISRLLLAALVCSFGHAAIAQATPAPGSDYTTSLPTVQQVENFQGTDPIDTAARQVAILEYLQVYIQRIRDGRQYNGPYTPGELKLRTDYAQAQYDLTQNFTKTHTPAEVQTFQQREGNYSVNNALDWIMQLEGQQAADTYRGTETTLAQTYQQHEDQLQRQMSDANAQATGGTLMDGFLAGSGGKVNLKPDQKRCLELGGTYTQCVNSIMDAALALGTMITSAMGAPDTGPPPPPPVNGIVYIGNYQSTTDQPQITLKDNAGAVLTKCGTLVDNPVAYTIRGSGAGTQLIVASKPNPFVLNINADNSLSGPGTIPVAGQIITGYDVVTYTHTGNCQPNCVTSTRTPIYKASTQSCTIKLLGRQTPMPALAVAGDYTSSAGLLLSFSDNHVTVDCGQAHINAPYAVDNNPTGFVVRIQNGGGAFQLAAAADGTLRGSGSTTINGKLVASATGTDVTFTPHSETCNVGTFTPKGAQKTTFASGASLPAAVASSAAPSSTPASAAANAPAPIADALAGAGISASPTSGQAQLRVLLSSSFTGTNPLAGQAVFVSRKPMDQILRELGVSIPANATPAQAMKALQTLCHSPQGCTSVVQKLPSYYVTTTKLDAAGKATLSATAATGAYYFFAIVPSGSGSTMWDVAASLAAGDNPVTFTQANSQQVQ